VSASPRAKLAKRWTAAQIREIELLLRQSPIDYGAIEQRVGRTPAVEGERIDLRAFPFSRAIDTVSISGLDLSYTRWNSVGGLTRVVATDSTLRSIRFEATPFSERFAQCDLARSTFSECQGMPDAVFEGCTFNEAKFVGCDFLRCLFRRCAFDRAKFAGAEFYECVFENCSLNDATFEDASFGRSRFIGLRTNVVYTHLEDMSERRYIQNPHGPIVALGETNMIGVIFE